jgi:hypothetical protein
LYYFSKRRVSSSSRYGNTDILFTIDMMAGGDCDGDLYAVLYNPDIVNYINQVEPEDYSKSKEAPEPVDGTSDMIWQQAIETTIESRIKDQTGRLGNMLLSLVERKNGVYDEQYKICARAYTAALVCLNIFL